MPIRAYCSICIDSIENASSVAAISCGHIFHLDCILDWLVSAPRLTCPQCRTDVGCGVVKLFFDFGEHDGHTLDAEWLKREEDRLNALLPLKEEQERQWENMARSEQHLLDLANAEIEDLEKRIRDMEALYSTQEEQLKLLNKHQLERKASMEETATLKEKLKSMEKVEKVLQSQRPDVEAVMRQIGSSPEALAQLAEYCVSATKEYHRLKEAHKESAVLNDYLKRELDASNNRAQTAEAEFQRLQQELNATLMEFNTIQNELRATQLEDQNAHHEMMDLKRKNHLQQETSHSALAANEAICRRLFNIPAPIGLQRPKLRLPGEVFTNSFDFPTASKDTIRPPVFQRAARIGRKLTKVRATRRRAQYGP